MIIACACFAALLWFIPYAELLVYPFRLFVTLIHEAGHALAALVTFGQVNRIALDWKGNGVTETIGGDRFLISSAGYLGATVYGAALLLLLRKVDHARAAALVTSALLLLLTVFLAGNSVAWIAGLFFGLGLLFLAVKASKRTLLIFMAFLAVQSLLNAFYDLRILMYLSVFEPSRGTDAQNMAAATAGIIPALVWAIGWGLVSLTILLLTLRFYYRSLKARSLYELPQTMLKQARRIPNDL